MKLKSKNNCKKRLMMEICQEDKQFNFKDKIVKDRTLEYLKLFIDQLLTQNILDFNK